MKNNWTNEALRVRKSLEPLEPIYKFSDFLSVHLCNFYNVVIRHKCVTNFIIEHIESHENWPESYIISIAGSIFPVSVTERNRFNIGNDARNESVCLGILFYWHNLVGGAKKLVTQDNKIPGLTNNSPLHCWLIK